MRRTRDTLFSMKLSLFLFCFLTVISHIAAEPVVLFNGKDLTGWSIDVPEATDESTFFVRDGMLVTSGKPIGHIYTDQEFENYTLTIEYRFSKKAGNCGVMIHSTTPSFFYKYFPRSIEVQMLSGQAGKLIPIGENIIGIDSKSTPKMIGRKKSRVIERLVKDAENTVGEWNTMIIHAQKDSVVILLNGQLVNVGTGCSVSRGKIALQSEGVELEFRKIDLKPISVK